MMSKNIDTKEPSMKIHKTVMKKLRNECVEIRYNERKVGCNNNQPGIKLGSCYKPFKTILTLIKDQFYITEDQDFSKEFRKCCG